MKDTRLAGATIYKWNAVFLCVVNIIFTFAGIILNSVVIMSLWNSQLRRKLCYFMILILACFDLAVVVVFHPLIIMEIISCWMSGDDKEANEHWVQYFICILFTFSFTALLTMTLERYLALVYPFFHEKFVTNLRLMISLLLLQSPFYISYIIEEKYGDLSGISYVTMGVVVLLLCILNIKLFFVARSLRKRAVVTLGDLQGRDSDPSNNLDPIKFKVTLSSSRKISACLLAVACLFVCYVPGIMWDLISGRSRNTLNSDQSWSIMRYWTDTLFTLNSTLNCLIFFYKNSVLRRHSQTFLKNRFCGKL